MNIAFNFAACSTFIEDIMATEILSERFKGLINGKDWKAGLVKRYDGHLTAISANEVDFYVYEESVSRFTGYLNLFGEDIYEGDLLAPDYNIRKGTGIVVWDNNIECWILQPTGNGKQPYGARLINHLNQGIVGHYFTHLHLVEDRTFTPKLELDAGKV